MQFGGVQRRTLEASRREQQSQISIDAGKAKAVLSNPLLIALPVSIGGSETDTNAAAVETIRRKVLVVADAFFDLSDELRRVAFH